MGSIRKREGQPFPDVAMCLSCIWYLTDVSAAGGAGTRIVPGSHRSDRNPFGAKQPIISPVRAFYRRCKRMGRPVLPCELHTSSLDVALVWHVW